MARLVITLLGGFDVAWNTSGNDPVSLRDFTLHKVRALLAYLVLHHDRAHTRAHLAGLLWPDVPEEKARTSLRTALATLRKHLEIVPGLERGAYIAADELSVRWQPQHAWSCDAVEFARLVESGRQYPAADTLEAAIALYHGHLLDGWYDEWVLPLQERWQQWYTGALDHLIALYQEQHNPRAALAIAQRMLQLDPLHEDAHRAAMLAYAQLGERAAMREQYQRCKQTLATQLRVNPSKITIELYRHLMSTDVSQNIPRLPAARVTTQPEIASGGASSSPENSSLLVGRSIELAAMAQVWQQAQHGQGGVLFVEGEAGIGKTRLVQALSAQAASQGGLLLHGGAYPMSTNMAFAPLLEAIRAPLLEKPVPQLTDLAPTWRAELAVLWPALWSAWLDLAPNPPLPSDNGQLRLFEALVQLVLHVSRTRPVMLVLEDIHWSDPSTLGWLSYALRGRRFQHTPVMLILTMRPEDAHGQLMLLEWRRLLLELPDVHHFVLNRLSHADVTTLLEALVQPEGGKNVRATVRYRAYVQRLYEESNGNPLFVTELVRSWHAAGLFSATSSEAPAAHEQQVTLEPIVNLPLPQRLHNLISERIARLSPDAQTVMRSAATISSPVPAQLLIQVSELDGDRALAALEELQEQEILLQVNDEHLLFSHEKLRETVYAGMNTLRQRQLHTRIAGALEESAAGTYPDRIERLAYHYTRSNEPMRALEYEIQAGDRSMAVSALAAASRSYSHALVLLDQLPATPQNMALQLELQLKLLPAIYRRDPPKISLERLHRAEQLAQELDNHAALAHIYIWRGRVLFILGKQTVAQAEYERSLAEQNLAHAAGVPAAHIPNRGWTYMLIGQSLYAQGDQREAYAYLVRSLPELTRLGGSYELGRCNSRLAGCCFYLFGDIVLANRYLDHALQIAQMANDRLLESEVAMSRAHFQLRHTNWQEGLPEMQAAHDIADQAQDTVVSLLCLYLGGYAAYRQGDLSTGRADLEQAVHKMRTFGMKLHFGVAAAYLAEVLWSVGETKDALELAREAYSVALDNADCHSQSVAARILGTLLIQADDRDAGERYLQESYDIAERLEILPFRAEAALALHRFYTEAGQIDRATPYLTEAHDFFEQADMLHWLATIKQPPASPTPSSTTTWARTA